MDKKKAPIADKKKKTASSSPKTTKANAVKPPKETVAGLKAKYLRLYADFENFRKRTEKEKIQYTTRITEKILSRMLPVQDSLTRALTTYADKPYAEGFKAIHEQLEQMLTQEGVAPIPTNRGDDFDPDLHTSTATAPAPTPELKGKIIHTVRKGYTLNGKVIRYTQVITGT